MLPESFFTFSSIVLFYINQCHPLFGYLGGRKKMLQKISPSLTAFLKSVSGLWNAFWRCFLMLQIAILDFRRWLAKWILRISTVC
jgi:hypothetical protein